VISNPKSITTQFPLIRRQKKNWLWGWSCTETSFPGVFPHFTIHTTQQKYFIENNSAHGHMNFKIKS